MHGTDIIPSSKSWACQPCRDPQSVSISSPNKALRLIAHELMRMIKENVTVGWAHRKPARANIRRLVKRILRKYGILLISRKHQSRMLCNKPRYSQHNTPEPIDSILSRSPSGVNPVSRQIRPSKSVPLQARSYWANYFHSIARGIDEREVNPNLIRKSLVVETSFADDLDDKKLMLAELEKLVVMLKQRLDKHGASYKRSLNHSRYHSPSLLTKGGSSCTDLVLIISLFPLASSCQLAASAAVLNGPTLAPPGETLCSSFEISLGSSHST
jgi:Domain of unknown function (DUF3387)